MPNILSAYYAEDKIYMLPLRMAVGEISLRDYTAQESARMVQVVREVHTPVVLEASIWEIFSEVAENYLKGIKNLDESADEMVSRLQLYLYEQ